MFLETAHHGKPVTHETWTQLQRFVRDIPADFRGHGIPYLTIMRGLFSFQPSLI